MNRFLPILLVLLLPAAAHAIPAGMMKIRVTGTDEQRQAVETLTDAGMELLAATLRESAQPTTRTISVRFSRLPAPVPETPLAVELPENPSLYETTHRLLQALLLRRALEIQPEDALLPPGDTGWLAAALTNRLLQNGLQARRNPLPDSTLFPPDGKMPAVKVLVNHPITPAQSALYLLYARRCDALLAVLEAKQAQGETRIRRIFALQARGRKAAEAIQICMLDQFEVNDNLQSWLQHAAEAYLQRLPHRLTCEEVQIRLAALPFPTSPLPPGQTESTTPRPPEPPDGSATMVIGPGRRDIPYHPQSAIPEETKTPPVTTPPGTPPPPPGETAQSKSTTPEDHQAVIRKLHDSLQQLHRDAPFLLQPAIQAYLLSADALGAGNPKRAQQLLVKARAEFGAAAARQQQLVTRLNELGEENLADELLRRQILSLARDSRNHQRALAPDIHEFLDREEAALAAGGPVE